MFFIALRERGRERERERERERKRERNIDMRNINLLPSIPAQTGDDTCHPGMYPDQELNSQSSNQLSHTSQDPRMILYK